jgi:hypothetical protein
VVTLHRRRLVLAGSLLGLAGCASAPDTAAPQPGQPQPWRTLQGGFLAPTLPPLGAPPRLASGMFVRWMSPAALALRGMELLVADLGTQRLWRADIAGNAINGIASAPVGPGMALALGPDLSAWVMDPVSRQVLRFARDGRLLQSYRIALDTATPVALALADGGQTLLLADGLGASWSEQHGPGGLLRSIDPERPGGRRLSGVDGLALGREGLFVLDRLAGAVHRVSRQGAVLQTLGQGDLMQPLALAVDRLDRVYVLEGQDGSIKRLSATAPLQRWSAAELGVQKIGGLAVDGLLLVLSDSLSGNIVLWSFMHEAAP